jgi:hypothetical protein
MMKNHDDYVVWFMSRKTDPSSENAKESDNKGSHCHLMLSLENNEKKKVVCVEDLDVSLTSS